MAKPTSIDLFSGSGMFSMAAEAAGFEVLAHCECDPFAQAVLAHRLPHILIFTDVREITKENFYERTGHKTVDAVCGGSPCQDLSVAGKQRGLAGERSGLFYEQMRIARELCAKYVVWENVPGALSSNQGRDFAAILGEFTGWDVGDFLDGAGTARWGNAGAFRARTERDFSVVYRIFDTRFFGIPQRRRRIYLVARLGTECRPEILFEPYGVRRHYEASGEAREGVAAFTASRFGKYSESVCAGTVKTEMQTGKGGSTIVGKWPSDVAATIDTAYATKYGYDDQHVNSGCPNFVCVHASQDPITSDKHAHALGANSTQAVCVSANIIGRQDHHGGHQIGVGSDVSFTLDTAAPHAVASLSGIRRLTPVECERLQGMPDNWTKVPYRGKTADKCPDSPRYKVCGNAVTKDVAEFVCAGVYEDFMKEAR